MILLGEKICIFTYGQTGSGKTYSLQGNLYNCKDKKEEGIIQRSIRSIYSALEKKGLEPKISCTMIELYFSQINDLLRPDDELPKVIRIQQNPYSGKVYFENAKVIHMEAHQGPDDLIQLFKQGLENRVVRSTNANETSSRSHLIFTLGVRSTKNDQIRTGKITFVDLAGSERPTRIGLDEEAYNESLHINSSL
jgi:hypothetical protein